MALYIASWALFGALLALPVAAVTWVMARGGGQLALIGSPGQSPVGHYF